MPKLKEVPYNQLFSFPGQTERLKIELRDSTIIDGVRCLRCLPYNNGRFEPTKTVWLNWDIEVELAPMSPYEKVQLDR